MSDSPAKKQRFEVRQFSRSTNEGRPSQYSFRQQLQSSAKSTIQPSSLTKPFAHPQPRQPANLQPPPHPRQPANPQPPHTHQPANPQPPHPRQPANLQPPPHPRRPANPQPPHPHQPANPQQQQQLFTPQSRQSFAPPSPPQSRQSFAQPSPQQSRQSFAPQQQRQSFAPQFLPPPPHPRQSFVPQRHSQNPAQKCKNVQVRRKNSQQFANHNTTNPYDVQDVDPLLEQYNFDVQGNIQRKFNPFPYCSIWTKRDVNEVFDNSDENPYEAGHFYALFHLLLGLPEINCQDSEALTRASKSQTEHLELWQLGNQFDLVYYIKEQRKFRIHIDKKQIYEPTKLFPLRTNEKSFPTIHDEDRMNLTTYCLFLKQKITSKIKNLF